MQGDRDPLAHRTGADHGDTTALDAAVVIDRHLDRGVTDRCGAAGDTRFGAGPLADADGVTEQQVQRGSGPALALGDLPGLAQLTEDLGLAHHRRIEPGGDLEQVTHSSVVVLGVEVRVQIVG